MYVCNIPFAGVLNKKESKNTNKIISFSNVTNVRLKIECNTLLTSFWTEMNFVIHKGKHKKTVLSIGVHVESLCRIFRKKNPPVILRPVTTLDMVRKYLLFCKTIKLWYSENCVVKYHQKQCKLLTINSITNIQSYPVLILDHYLLPWFNRIIFSVFCGILLGVLFYLI